MPPKRGNFDAKKTGKLFFVSETEIDMKPRCMWTKQLMEKILRRQLMSNVTKDEMCNARNLCGDKIQQGWNKLADVKCEHKDKCQQTANQTR